MTGSADFTDDAAGAGNFSTDRTGWYLMWSRPVSKSVIAYARYEDFDPDHNASDDKANAGRSIKLPPATAKLFAAAAKDKLPAAPLFARADGRPWDKDMWKDPIKAAVRAAELPGEATAYTLRHSVITDLVHGGLDLLTVAQVAGTSVRMIEKHYGHLRDTVAADALAKLAL